MASVRFRIFRIPAEGDAEIIIDALTDAEAEAIAVGVRYWIAPGNAIGILAIPRRGT